jgi:2-oxo-4-hydroxy-4-carboxy-5-ureidoimidazoline decarboxylase
MTIGEINSLDQAGFTAALGWVFENSPWVAERAWVARPFADLEALHRAMTEVLKTAGREECLALLRAHPDLGTRARMSEVSTGEQAGAGLDQLTKDEFDSLHRHNTAYREKFGFPFLYAVRGGTKAEILRAIEERLSGTQEAEYCEALRQVSRIARFRLEDLIG